jgi:tetrahydromethanopterin S-methyltransferase subunit G
MTEWNDSRLNELNKRVDDGFAEMRQGFSHVNRRIDTMQKTLMQIGGGILVALIGLIATQV